MPQPKTTAPDKFPIEQFIGTDHRRAIACAGMVEATPELAEAAKTEDEWNAELEAYLNTPTKGEAPAADPADTGADA